MKCDRGRRLIQAVEGRGGREEPHTGKLGPPTSLAKKEARLPVRVSRRSQPCQHFFLFLLSSSFVVFSLAVSFPCRRLADQTRRLFLPFRRNTSSPSLPTPLVHCQIRRSPARLNGPVQPLVRQLEGRGRSGEHKDSMLRARRLSG